MRIQVGRDHFAEIDEEDFPLVLPYKWLLMWVVGLSASK